MSGQVSHHSDHGLVQEVSLFGLGSVGLGSDSCHLMDQSSLEIIRVRLMSCPVKVELNFQSSRLMSGNDRLCQRRNYVD